MHAPAVGGGALALPKPALKRCMAVRGHGPAVDTCLKLLHTLPLHEPLLPPRTCCAKAQGGRGAHERHPLDNFQLLRWHPPACGRKEIMPHRHVDKCHSGRAVTARRSRASSLALFRGSRAGLGELGHTRSQSPE